MSELVIQSVAKSFATAVDSLNLAFSNASKEISTLRKNVAANQNRQQQQTIELANAKAELARERTKVVKVCERKQELEKELSECTKHFNVMKQQRELEEERATQLEQQIVGVANWKHKTAIAEKESAKLHAQFSALKTALTQLMPSENSKTVRKTATGSHDSAVDIKEKTNEDDGSKFISAMDAVRVRDPTSKTTTNSAPAPTATEAVPATPEPVPQVPVPEPVPQEVPRPIVRDSRYKTQLCRFHQRGDCQHGTNCLYAHGEKELRFSPGKYHKQVTAVAGMGFDVDIAVIGALFQEYKGNVERVLAKLVN